MENVTRNIVFFPFYSYLIIMIILYIRDSENGALPKHELKWDNSLNTNVDD